MNDDQNNSESFILFELAGTTYGVRSRNVQQLDMIEHITPVPNALSAVEGVVFLRGQVIPALNLRARFGFEKIPYDLRTRLLVININERSIGLIVDAAREFVKFSEDAIMPPSTALTGLSGKYLEGVATIDERIVLVLNLDEVTNVGERLAINQSA